MGCFGYICKGCGTPINGDALIGGEKCIMIHVRHGKEIGRVEGHYDEYGRVIEQRHLPEAERYRGHNEGPNGHRAICDSEFSMGDSYLRLQERRVHKNREVSYSRYRAEVQRELRLAHGNSEAERLTGQKESNGTLERKYAALPLPTRESYSGTAAWHSRCYNLASPEAKADLTPSESDPDQSWGRVRKKYK